MVPILGVPIVLPPTRTLLFTGQVSHYGVTGSMRSRGLGWVCLRNHSPEPQAAGTGHEREVTIFGFGCPCRNNSRSRRRAGWRGTQPWNDRQARRVDPQADQKAWPGRPVAGLLRSRPDGLRTVLAADAVGSPVRCGGAEPSSEEAGRSREDGPAGRVEAGTQSSLGRSDCGLGSGRGLGSLARSCPGTRGGQARSVASAAPANQAMRPRLTFRPGSQKSLLWESISFSTRRYQRGGASPAPHAIAQLTLMGRRMAWRCSWTALISIARAHAV